MPSLIYTGSTQMTSTSRSRASFRLRTVKNMASHKKRPVVQLVMDLPRNQLNQEERKYKVTITVPPAYKEDGDEGEEVQDLAHVSKVKKIKRNTFRTEAEETIGYCLVCWDESCGCVMCPCGHINTCYDCGRKIHLSGDPCPVCHQNIKRIQKIYLSCSK